MTDLVDALKEWQAYLDDFEQHCPWTGPRPYDDSQDRDRRPFLGREKDAFDLVTAIRDHRLVMLHGESAVGKSSFIAMGLQPSLSSRLNARPILCNSWTTSLKHLGHTTDADLAFEEMDKFIGQVIFGNTEGSILGNSARSMREDLRDDIKERGATASFARWTGKMPVLVLDQFEEFLLEASQSGNYGAIQQFFSWILRATQDETIKLRIVLSFRSDHLSKLRPLQARLNAFQFRVIELRPMTDESAVRRLIEGGWAETTNRMNPVNVSDELAKDLFDRWSFHKDQPEALFGLQAQLYALFWQSMSDSQKSGQDRIWLGKDTGEDVKRDSATSRLARKRHQKVDLQTASFARAFELKIKHCESAMQHVQSTIGSDVARLPIKVFLSLVRNHIRYMADHLSTDSYKERRGLFDLLKLSCPRELERLCDDDATPENNFEGGTKGLRLDLETQVSQVVACLWDGHPTVEISDGAPVKSAEGTELLAQPASSVLRSIGARLPRVPDLTQLRKKEPVDCAPWLQDRLDNSAGGVLGLPDAVTTIEFIRMFLLAILWLTASDICRMSESRIYLVHDRLGGALRDWARDFPEDDPQVDLSALTAVVGDWCHWDMSDISTEGNDPKDLPDHWSDWRDKQKRLGLMQPESSPFVANARLRGCLIYDVYFRNMTFLNCDFQNTHFENCVFDNVQFVNCLLDGVALETCTVRGTPDDDALRRLLSPNQISRVFSGHVARFYTEDAPDVVDYLQYFRRTKESPPSVTRPVLFSISTGMPAIVTSRRRAVAAGADPIVNLGGGLTLLGGRMSNFMAVGCKFDNNIDEASGQLAIAFSAGASVDFVEQDQLDVFVLGCALRGLSVSRPLRDGTPSPISVSVEESHLAGPWFSDKLSGIATFRDSKVWGGSNLSRTRDPRGRDGLFIDGVDFDLDPKTLPKKEQKDRDRDRRALPNKTDYRSNSAEFDLILRRTGGVA